MAELYVTKQFAGSSWQALRHYARQTYANLLSFFRENQTLFHQLSSGNGAIQKLKQRLEHAERFSDPAIRHTVEPLLDRYGSQARGPDEIADEMHMAAAACETASQLLNGEVS